MEDIEKRLFRNIEQLIEESKKEVAISVNQIMSKLYWNIGKEIKMVILNNQKPNYGKQVIENLSEKLSASYGRGYSKTNLFNVIKVYEVFDNEQIFHALSGKLSWTHLRKLMYIDDELKREFYIEMSKLENWSTRTLQNRMKSMLYERTSISKKPNETIKKDLEILKKEKQINQDLVFRDPYLLDFLDLKDTYSEKDLETAILADLQRFLIELGNDFAFLARQKRITIDHTDYYIDLLFYHRRLKSLVAIDLKLGDFEAGYKGQMELYLRYLEKYEKVEGENSPIGLILCSGKNEEHIELLDLERSNIKVAEYLTILPPLQLLKEKLHKAILYAKEKNS
ncbi:PDDEXK nuclease domain-containing protein [Bernardetia sp.]|uniref:PDDEXK nuclease domain-containing protein n=1 Tax=Bernardetia sp. TaxID=1937974 RepID=UPI0025B80446|nr:PDDEXK nuclease domain-containing protein [Bernardetia sp.]